MSEKTTYEPRQIIKENANLYRETELNRIESEELNHFLFNYKELKKVLDFSEIFFKN